MYIDKQTFLILGISKSGFSAGNYILKRGGKCYLYEEHSSEKITNAILELEKNGAVNIDKEQVDEILDKIDVVIISPGVAINHPIAIKAKNLNKKIIGELEFGFSVFNPITIAVTGTNGKTTTCSVIGEIINKAGINCKLIGNIGVPVTSKIEEISFDSVCVAEVSSFQLESIANFLPHIACILNISPDHLERHYSMDNYIYLKKRLLFNQRQSEYAVLNYDDEIVKGFAQDCKSKVIFISIKERVNGAYLLDETLYFYDEKIINVKDISLKGEHNIYNVLFAIASAKIMGIDNEIIKDGIVNFKGVAHRIQFVLEKNGVKFYNDSKATNTSSTISAIKTMDRPTILILGGSEKGEKYEGLFEEIKLSQIKHVVLTGASRFNMLNACGNVGYSNVSVTPDFEYAVKLAFKIAEENENVLLSPACASFDNFKDYEDRGLKFISIVEEID